MEKGIIHYLNSESIKAQRKNIFIEANTNVINDPSIIQSVKHTALENILSNRYKDYKKHANNVRVAVSVQRVVKKNKVRKESIDAAKPMCIRPGTTKGRQIIKFKSTICKDLSALNNTMDRSGIIQLGHLSNANSNLAKRRNYMFNKSKHLKGFGLIQPITETVESINKETSKVTISTSKGTTVRGNTVEKYSRQKQSHMKTTVTPKAQTQRFSLWRDKKINTNNPEPTPSSIKEVKQDFPFTPIQALKYLRDRLTSYEKTEILDYEMVYYVGNESYKRQIFDDENGDYMAYVGDHIGFRYEIIDIFGKGSFGQVLKCKDHKVGEIVALKIIRNHQKFFKQALVEIKILQFIKDNDPDDKSNIVKIFDSFVFRRHVCITFEPLSMNLYDLIKQNNFKGLSLTLIHKFAIQILQSLLLLKKHSIIHCDLKPENILLKKSSVKLIDFGSSCFTQEQFYTYIQSRFYRAPEIMLALPYTTAIDMWSFGCILFELFTGSPLFPGETESKQMALIIEANGLPPQSLLSKAIRKEVFFKDDGKPLPTTSVKERSVRSIESALRTAEPEFVDFIRCCLVWDPVKRLSPEEALIHPWITKANNMRNTKCSRTNRVRLSLNTTGQRVNLNKGLGDSVSLKIKTTPKGRNGLNKIEKEGPIEFYMNIKPKKSNMN